VQLKAVATSVGSIIFCGSQSIAIMLGRSRLAIQIEVRDSGKIEWICQVNNRHFDVPFDLPTRRGFREDIALQYFAA
jgi:hypothetical protein